MTLAMSRDEGDERWFLLPRRCCGVILQGQPSEFMTSCLERLGYSGRWHTFTYSGSDQTTSSFSLSNENESMHIFDMEAQEQHQSSVETVVENVQPNDFLSRPSPRKIASLEKLQPTESDLYTVKEETTALLSTKSISKPSEDVRREKKLPDPGIEDNSNKDVQPRASLPDYTECRVNALPQKPDLEVVVSPPPLSLEAFDEPFSNEDDCIFSNEKDTDQETVLFSLRLPNVASLHQRKIDQMQRAERTHDFMETAKSLSLQLDRDKWSVKRSRRGSMVSTSSYTSSVDTSYDASMSTPGHERRSSQGSRLLNRPPLSRNNSVTSLHELLHQEAMALRASPTRQPEESQNRTDIGCDDSLRKFELPLQDEDKEDTTSASLANCFGKISNILQQSGATEDAFVCKTHRGRRAPRRHSFLAGSKIDRFDSVSNSSGNGSGHFRCTRDSPRRRTSLNEGTSSRRSSVSNGQDDKDLQQQRHDLGYEDIEVPIKCNSFDTDLTGSRRSSGSGGGGALFDDSYRRSRGRRAPRRSSFVAGSKIERYDAHGHSSSGSGRKGRWRVGGRRTSN
jgi:hypothetical protein